MDQLCSHCGSKMFALESVGNVQQKKFSLCCNQGKVNLPQIRPPPEELYSLFTGTSPAAKNFRENIRAFNSAFQFSSLQADIDLSTLNSGRSGIYTFKISGSLHHCLPPLLPHQNGRPCYAQIYLYDPTVQLQTRTNLFSQIYPETVDILQQMMNRINPFVSQWKSAREITHNHSNLSNIQIVLRPNHQQHHQRHTHNLPTSDEISVLIIDPSTADHERVQRRDVALFGRDVQNESGRVTHITDTSPLYHPLSFPLFFPYGDWGWTYHQSSDSSDSSSDSSDSSVMRYYAYRLMIRDHWNPVHDGGRLLQEYVVTQFCKMEQERLQMIANIQDNIRRHIHQGIVDAATTDDTNIMTGADIG